MSAAGLNKVDLAMGDSGKGVKADFNVLGAPTTDGGERASAWSVFNAGGAGDIDTSFISGNSVDLCCKCIGSGFVT